MPFDPQWLSTSYPSRDKKAVYTHLVVVCDTFDHEDYPVYVKLGQDVRKVVAEYNGPNMQRVMEVYDLTESEKTLAQQQLEHRSFNYGKLEGPKFEAWAAAQTLAQFTDKELQAELARRDMKSQLAHQMPKVKVVRAGGYDPEKPRNRKGETVEGVVIRRSLPPLTGKDKPKAPKRQSYRGANESVRKQIAAARAEYEKKVKR